LTKQPDGSLNRCGSFKDITCDSFNFEAVRHPAKQLAFCYIRILTPLITATLGLGNVDSRSNLLRGCDVTRRWGVEQGLVGVKARVGKVLQLKGSATVDVVPFVADQGDLVKNGGVDAQVVSLVAIGIATMEHLALGVGISVEAWSSLGSAVEFGLRDGVVGGIRILATAGFDVGHFGGIESRFQKVIDVLSGETAEISTALKRSLGADAANQGDEGDDFHHGGRPETACYFSIG